MPPRGEIKGLLALMLLARRARTSGGEKKRQTEGVDIVLL